MNAYLFSYGTLQNEKVQLELFGRILQGRRGVLKGYRAVPIEITESAFLSKGEQNYQLIAVHSNDKNDHIKGTVFEISEDELLLADKYEPANYKRNMVTLVSGKKAWVYKK
ncbi:MAG: gamma-glutamylcyclotransferase family protein [Chitinophagaceae bacterium]